MEIRTEIWERRFHSEADSRCLEVILRWATALRALLEIVAAVLATSAVALMVSGKPQAQGVALASAIVSAILATVLSQSRIEKLRDAYVDVSTYEAACLTAWRNVDSATEATILALVDQGLLLRKKYGGLIPTWLRLRADEWTRVALGLS
jgi:uncharacterized membrane protein YkvI